MKKSFWTTSALSVGYLALALALLIHWGSANPWQSVDVFSGGYLILRFIGSAYSLLSSREAFQSKSVMREWWALHSDPAGPSWVMFLMGLDLLVFVDYGHWHLVSRLINPWLQMVGLTLYLLITLWQIWTDAYLANFFNQSGVPRLPMDKGPYRYIRHPRYGAAIGGKVAMALALGSIFAWVLVIAWAQLLLSKMAVEERHLKKLFGPQYESYARTTAKVIPGIY